MGPKHHITTLENLRMYTAHACYPQEKWPIIHPREGALDLSEKTPQILLPVE